MGVDIKLNVKQSDNNCDLPDPAKFENLAHSILEIPEFDIKDQEIEFIDPERVKIEKLEKEKANEDFEEENKGPVLMGKSLTKNKRSQYLQQLHIKTRKA